MSKTKLFWRYVQIPFKTIQYATWYAPTLQERKNGYLEAEQMLGLKTGYELAKIILLPL